MCIILIAAGIIDLMKRKIPNIIDIMILLWAVFFSKIDLYEKAVGFVFTALILLIVSCFVSAIKGGDVKFLIVCAAALGLTVFAKVLLFTCFISVLWSIIKKEKSVPLAFTFMLAYFINLLI